MWALATRSINKSSQRSLRAFKAPLRNEREAGSRVESACILLRQRKAFRDDLRRSDEDGQCTLIIGPQSAASRIPEECFSSAMWSCSLHVIALARLIARPLRGRVGRSRLAPLASASVDDLVVHVTPFRPTARRHRLVCGAVYTLLQSRGGEVEAWSNARSAAPQAYSCNRRCHSLRPSAAP